MKQVAGLFFILAILALPISWCSHNIYQMYQDFPEYAKETAIRAQYGDYIDQVSQTLETLAQNNNSFFSSMAALEQLDHPESLILLAVQRSSDQDEPTPVIGSLENSSKVHFTISGYGYGTFNEQPILIVEQSVNSPVIDSYLLYFLDHNRPVTSDKP